ncbi:MAG: hypothetical protein WCR20_24035, partial [Verrucomicrobiota bacterium]
KGISLTPESQKLVEEKKFLINGKVQAVSSKRLICRRSVERESAACIAEGYRVQTEQEEFLYLGRYVATKERNLLLRGERVLRDSVTYRWGAPWFLSALGVSPGSTGGCGAEPRWWSGFLVETTQIEIQE